MYQYIYNALLRIILIKCYRCKCNHSKTPLMYIPPDTALDVLTVRYLYIFITKSYEWYEDSQLMQ
jgi:hypothetical protein